MRKIFYWLLFLAILILLGAGWYYYSAVKEMQKGVEITVDNKNIPPEDSKSNMAKEEDLTSVTAQGVVVSVEEQKIEIKSEDGRSESWEIAEKPIVQALNMENLIYEDVLLSDIKVNSSIFISGLGNSKRKVAHLIQSETHKKYEGVLKSIESDSLVLELLNGTNKTINYDKETNIVEMQAAQQLVKDAQLLESSFLVVYCQEDGKSCLAKEIVTRKKSGDNVNLEPIPLAK